MTTLQVARAYLARYGVRVPSYMPFPVAAARILERMGMREGEAFILSQADDPGPEPTPPPTPLFPDGGRPC